MTNPPAYSDLELKYLPGQSTNVLPAISQPIQLPANRPTIPSNSVSPATQPAATQPAATRPPPTRPPTNRPTPSKPSFCSKVKKKAKNIKRIFFSRGKNLSKADNEKRLWLRVLALGCLLALILPLTLVLPESIRKWNEIANQLHFGCFKNKAPPNAEFSQKYKDQKSLSAKKCIIYCDAHNYTIAALQDGHICYCGHSYGLYGKVNEDECDKKCPGNNFQTCGGYWRYDAYNATYSNGFLNAPSLNLTSLSIIFAFLSIKYENFL